MQERLEKAMAPPLQAFDHIHVFVSDRAAAEMWYRRVLGLTRTAELQAWAANGGPLTVQNADGTIHLALFERPVQPCRSTIALRVSASAFAAWRVHLTQALGQAPSFEDHQMSVSLYFSDPDGNPYEITTYDVGQLVGRSG